MVLVELARKPLGDRQLKVSSEPQRFGGSKRILFI
jgi:hypothetical protein